ncbi:MAG: DUF2273 domain-containing protein [Acidimicrobiia bacterium]
MRNSQVGLILGALLGLALVIEGFGDMLIVALVAFVGWVVARVVQGDLDLTEFLSGRRGRTTTRPGPGGRP